MLYKAYESVFSMETLHLDQTAEIRRNLAELERTLKVKIKIVGKKVTIEGEPMNEYEAVQIFEAMGLGFSSREALQLKDEDMIFRIIALKDFTRRKDLREVRARVIGAKGQTKRVIEEISGCKIVVKEDNLIGIIGHSESIDAAITAITNIIKGTKQANAYRYLEKMNKIRKENKFLENIKINNKNKK